MELLTEVIDVNELMRLRVLFESNGIAIHISNEDTARNFGLIYPARKYGLFVVYENQFDDAKALLEDDNHEVKNPLNLDEYREIMKLHAAESSNKMFNVSMNIFVISICVILVLALYLKVTST